MSNLRLGLVGSLSWSSAIIVKPDGTYVAVHSTPTWGLHYREMPDDVLSYALSGLVRNVMIEASSLLNTSLTDILDSFETVIVAIAGLDNRFARVPITGLVERLIAHSRGLNIIIRGIGETCACATFLDKPGIMVRVGAGCSVFGRNSEGAQHLTNAWSFLPGDHGGGYHIGQQVLGILTRVYDGRACHQERQFAEKAQEILGATATVPDFFSQYRMSSLRGVYMREITKLSDLAFKIAEDNCDPIANQILDCAAKEIRDGIRAVITRLKLIDEVNIAFQGSLIAEHPSFARRLYKYALQLNNKVQLMHKERTWSRVVGAGLLALSEPKNDAPFAMTAECKKFLNSLPPDKGLDDPLRLSPIKIRDLNSLPPGNGLNNPLKLSPIKIHD